MAATSIPFNDHGRDSVQHFNNTILLLSGETENILMKVSTIALKAPASMKVVSLSLIQLTKAVGNLIDIVVMSSFEGVLPKQVLLKIL